MLLVELNFGKRNSKRKHEYEHYSQLLGRFFNPSLFPGLCPCTSAPLTDRHLKLLDFFAVLKVDKYVLNAQWMGRKRMDRSPIARAFIAKAVYDLPTTDMLIDLLHSDSSLRKICGFETKKADTQLLRRFHGRLPTSSQDRSGQSTSCRVG